MKKDIENQFSLKPGPKFENLRNYGHHSILNSYHPAKTERTKITF